MVIASLAALALLVLVHVTTPGLKFLEGTPRTVWLSAAGGVSGQAEQHGYHRHQRNDPHRRLVGGHGDGHQGRCPGGWRWQRTRHESRSLVERGSGEAAGGLLHLPLR